jgi:HD-GYP domain-containing protein (c-di-GMP phosphodiesterase class II)
LRVNVLSVCLAGPQMALSVLAGQGTAPHGADWLAAALLLVGAAVACRFQMQITYQTKVDVSSTAYMAMILVLPWGYVGALAVLANLAGLARRGSTEPLEAFFNTGQSALYTTAGAGAAAGVWALAGHGQAAMLGAAVAAAVTMHLVNTCLVAFAASMQLGRPPLRVWRASVTEDVPQHAALALLGGVAAVVAAHEPLLLPALALPAVLVHTAVRNYVRLRADTSEALATLVDIVELRDPYTAGHSRRVAETARALALALDLTAEEADEIETAGRVHDLGKVAVDPLVLTKPGKLTDAEFAEMARHPVFGADVIAKFNAFTRGNALVRHHHERMDGLGYPDGLAGEAIPLGARILAVADTFDALTSDRPYRKGMNLDKALSILREGAGTQWDARVVDAMLALQSVAPAQRADAAPAPDAPPVAVLAPARA